MNRSLPLTQMTYLFAFILILLLLDPVRGQLKCPYGGASTSQKCPGCKVIGVQICYTDVGGNNEPGCCDTDGGCPYSKMRTFHSRNNANDVNVFSYKYESSKDDIKNNYYKRTHTDSGPLGVACPIPVSYTVNKNGAAGIRPVDYNDQNAETDKSPLKPCNLNSDCKADEFCDAAYNPSYDKKIVNAPTGDGLDASDNGKPVQFCYKKPAPPPKMEHAPHDFSLKICNKHVDCGKEDEVCHTTDTDSFRNISNPGTLAQGICMTVRGCDATDATQSSVLNVNSQFCDQDASCEGAGISKGNYLYDPKCREYYQGDLKRKLCCFVKLPPCRIKQTATPLKQCTNMEDCWVRSDPKDKFSKIKDLNVWCNDGDTKACCTDKETNREWQCPDLATPLFNEPKCIGYDPKAPSSGKCPQKSGRCHNGHCCPPLAVTLNGTKVTLGKDQYETKFKCNPKKPLPNLFTNAYCNADTKMVVIAGKFHTNGDSMTKVSGAKCTTNADCSSDGSQVCIYESQQVHVCYYNPLRPLRPEVSSFWKIVLIASLVCGAVFLVSTIICFVCYRSKSVFDKYNPRKKKGKKGDKDSSSASKSKSKDSKKEKSGKKKKGKKGAEGESDKSSVKDPGALGADGSASPDPAKSEVGDANKSQLNN